MTADLFVDGPQLPSEPEAPTEEELAAALEAVCFVLNRPLTVGEAASMLRCTTPDLRAAAGRLAERLRGGGLMLQQHDDEIQLVTRPEVAWGVQRALNPERPARLSRASLETLAIVAYRQPVTRAAVEDIRGVGCEATLDNLERRELIREVGRQETPGHPRLYGTTLRFLQVVGLERIEDLPPLDAGASPAVTAALLGLEASTEEEPAEQSPGTPEPAHQPGDGPAPRDQAAVADRRVSATPDTGG